MNRNKKQSNDVKIPSRKIIRYLLLIILLVVTYKVILNYLEPQVFPIEHLKLNGEFNRINVPQLQQSIKPLAKGFFSTNMMKLKREIERMPFVDEVSIKRIWPNTLLLTLTEIEFVADWGKDAALTSHGQVMPIKVQSEKQLPVFFGPENQASKMLEQYKELSTLLLPYNLSIAELSLNLRNSWRITLDNGTQILLGRKDIYPHLATFLQVYPKIKKLQDEKIVSIDLRHSNGLSVKTAP